VVVEGGEDTGGDSDEEGEQDDDAVELVETFVFTMALLLDVMLFWFIALLLEVTIEVSVIYEGVCSSFSFDRLSGCLLV